MAAVDEKPNETVAEEDAEVAAEVSASDTPPPPVDDVVVITEPGPDEEPAGGDAVEVAAEEPSTEEPSGNEWDAYDLAAATDVAFVQDQTHGDYVMLHGLPDEHGNASTRVRLQRSNGREWQYAWQQAHAEG